MLYNKAVAHITVCLLFFVVVCWAEFYWDEDNEHKILSSGYCELIRIEHSPGMLIYTSPISIDLYS